MDISPRLKKHCSLKLVALATLAQTWHLQGQNMALPWSKTCFPKLKYPMNMLFRPNDASLEDLEAPTSLEVEIFQTWSLCGQKLPCHGVKHGFENQKVIRIYLRPN